MAATWKIEWNKYIYGDFVAHINTDETMSERVSLNWTFGESNKWSTGFQVQNEIILSSRSRRRRKNRKICRRWTIIIIQWVPKLMNHINEVCCPEFWFFVVASNNFAMFYWNREWNCSKREQFQYERKWWRSGIVSECHHDQHQSKTYKTPICTACNETSQSWKCEHRS